MIVVSGGLVLVAIVLLVVGLIGEGLLWVYLSIGVSIVAGGFLLLGALQRRGEPTLAGAPAGPGLTPAKDPLDRVGAVSVSRPSAGVEEPDEAPARTAVGAAALAGALAGGESGGSGGSGGSAEAEVAVVPGRPRYHVESCRFLAGRTDVETIALADAREEGYTACGVCKPDQAIAAAELDEEPEEPELEDEADEVEEEPAPAPRRAARPAAKAPVKAAKAAKPAAKAAKPAAKAAKAPAKAVTKAAQPAEKAAAGGTVVVIPDRDKYHVSTCRFVRDVAGTMTVSKATAKKQGYAACGVCKP